MVMMITMTKGLPTNLASFDLELIINTGGEVVQNHLFKITIIDHNNYNIRSVDNDRK